jgi:ribonuclease H-related protein
VRIDWETRRTAAHTDGGQVEVYTDGSAQAGKAGWGLCIVVVRDGREEHAAYGPVTSGAHTNNVGELQGIREAVHWARQREISITIRYDSKYAAAHARGQCRIKKNVAEVRRLREEVARARKCISLEWLHVKGHSGDKWNDRADELADLGRDMCTPQPAQQAPRQRPARETQQP